MNTNEPKAYKTSRIMYTAEAAFEYLISILVGGSFLATLTSTLGMSDSLTGIISSFISLGCLFQLFSVFLHRKRMKPLVILMSVINQVLFLLLYVIPLSSASKPIKTVVFIVVIFSAYIIYNIAHPKKINWLMSLVDDLHRGSFTANKEIISLLAGMIFQFSMGAVIDSFTERGMIKQGFITAAVVLLVLTVLHTLAMLFTVEKEIPQPEKKSIIETVRTVAADKGVLRVSLVFVFYYAANYASVPFHGTYQINELGFSLKFVSSLAIFSSITRILVSKFWGRFADRRSFAVMIDKCFAVLGLSYACYAFATPENGKIAVTLYYLLHGIALGGINSALINLIFDHVSPDRRADSLAISQAASGIVGFASTLAISPLITYIQNNGNSFLGLPIYAQQFTSVLSMILTVFAIIYVRKVIIKKK